MSAATRGPNLDILGRLGVTVVEIDDEQTWELHFSEISQCSLIVDAIFGTGLQAGARRHDGNGRRRRQRRRTFPIVSIDLPSGMSADTPHLVGDCIDASMTVTLAAPKLPLVLPPGETHAGDVVIADIGIPHEVIDSARGPAHRAADARAAAALVEPRARRLAQGRLRPGDDRRRIARQDRRGVSGRDGCPALRRGPRDRCHACVVPANRRVDGARVHDRTAGRNGTGRSWRRARSTRCWSSSTTWSPADPASVATPATAGFVRALLERATVPLVLDADALTVLADDPSALVGSEERDVIITPHPGEMARLIGASVEEVQANRIEVAPNFAATHHLYVVLKGHRTMVATPEGHVFINPTGNPGMATGGTGDVLTGMIAAWLAQLLDAEAACRLAVFLHGAAGDLAERRVGQVAMTATDLVALIGQALGQLVGKEENATS